MIKTKSIYHDPISPDDGLRVLVMRKWPRGISKDKISVWKKELAPSLDLLAEWNSGLVTEEEYRQRFLLEMERPESRNEIHELAQRAASENVTLLCKEREGQFCHRYTVKGLIEKEIVSMTGKTD
jgi:uncharacterized protein YeaO (DUF488 family)